MGCPILQRAVPTPGLGYPNSRGRPYPIHGLSHSKWLVPLWLGPPEAICPNAGLRTCLAADYTGLLGCAGVLSGPTHLSGHRWLGVSTGLVVVVLHGRQ
jgi:hypothetical protein